MLSVLRNLYRKALHNYPTVTQSVQVGLLMSTSDICAQCIVEKTPLNKIDWVRNSKFGAMGLLYVGPALKTWFGILDKIVDPKQKAWKRGLKKVTIDQLCFAPFFLYSIVGLMGVIQGHSIDEIKKTLRTDYYSVLKHNYMLWPAANLINFSLIPLNFQVVYVQLVAILWNTYLSLELSDHQ